jgi:hypothetical protein
LSDHKPERVCVDEEPTELIGSLFGDVQGHGRLKHADPDTTEELGDEPLVPVLDVGLDSNTLYISSEPTLTYEY